MIILRWIAGSVAIMISAYLVPGVHVESFFVALIVALVLGILNLTIKPIILLLTLPINLLTLGLFTLVINAALVLLAASFVRGFQVADFSTALVFGIVLSVLMFLVHHIFS